MSNPTEKKQNYDMSMEDILASIRKYVSTEEAQATEDSGETRFENSYDQYTSQSKSDNVIKLGESELISDDDHMATRMEYVSPHHEEVYEESSSLSQNVSAKQDHAKSGGPFDKLADALKSYGKQNNKPEKTQKSSDITMDQFLSNIAGKIIKDWADANLPKITEEIILREIEKIKSE